MYGTSRRFDTGFYSFLEKILPRFLPQIQKVIVYQYVLSLSTPVSCSKKKGHPQGGLSFWNRGSRTHLNAAARWAFAGCRLDSIHYLVQSTPISGLLPETITTG